MWRDGGEIDIDSEMTERRGERVRESENERVGVNGENEEKKREEERELY